jgi:hypothetical protein
VANNCDTQRGAADAFHQQTQVDDIAHPARDLEVALDVNEGKPVLTPHDQPNIIVAEFLRVPVLDQAVEHVEVVWKVDNAGRVAMREADRDAPRERAGRRNELILRHGAISLHGRSLPPV